MSLHPRSHRHVPEATEAAFTAAFPKGHPFLTLRDELGSIFADADFAHLYEQQGRPVESPATLALVLVLQFMEGLTDRQAAAAVCDRLSWRYLLGLDMDDPGFDYSLLSDFRQRLVNNQAEQLLFDHVLTAFIQRGLVKGGGKQRTDATPVIAAVRHLNRLELAGETLRQALNHLAIVAPDWLRSWVPSVWYERYGERIDSFRLPKAQHQRDALARTIGQDGQTLLTALDQADTPPELATEPAVETLRQVWAQQYVQTDTGIRWRTKEELPPNAKRIASPYDPDARASTKRDLRWEGYQVHVTETCDDDAPHLITHVETVPATTPDVTQTATIHEALAKHDLLPSEHYVDGGYTSAAHLAASQEQDITLIGPVGGNTSWQAQTEDGIPVQQFTIDWERQVATCPEDHQSVQWRAREHEVRVTFDRETCAACPLRERCTQATQTGRVLHLHPQPQQEALEARRAEQQTPAFREQYQRRAGVEGTISQGVRRFGMRRCRYTGLAKTHLQHMIMAVAINLVRLLAWLMSPPDAPPAVRRPSAFAELQVT